MMNTCMSCGKNFQKINEEATGSHLEAPPELRCGDCQVAYRVKGGNKSKHLTWADWTITQRMHIVSTITEMRYDGISTYGERVRKLETMMVAMYGG